MRSRRETITFRNPFRINGIDRLLPAGAYELITDEEMIEGLSFPSFRRVATMIMVPAGSPHSSAMEMVSVASADLSEAQRIDASGPHEWHDAGFGQASRDSCPEQSDKKRERVEAAEVAHQRSETQAG